MFYTDLDKLQGLNSPTDYGSGVEFANGIISVFPDSKIGLQVSFCVCMCVCIQNIINLKKILFACDCLL